MLKPMKLALFGLLAVVVAACTAPIDQVERQPFPAGTQTLSMDQIENAIVRAANGREWVVSEKSPGRLIATYSPRDHVAKVEIDYNKKDFSILYVDSTNLKYDGTHIHHNYNRWVNNLREDILREVSAEIVKAS